MTNKNKHFFLIAGESSGDLHGSELIHSLSTIHPNSIFTGIGGRLMQKRGLKSITSIEKLAVMGFWEVMKQFRFFMNLEKKVLQKIKTNQPDTIVLIDYPGFNLRIAKKIKQQYDIPIIYYISPQIWAWKEKRINSIKKYVDKLIVIFPFEVEWYKARSVAVEYFGHPLIDQWNKSDKIIKKNNLNKITIGLFPGSRKQEIDKHLPIFKSLIDQKNKINTDVQFVISQSELISPSSFEYFKKNNVPVLSCSLYEALSTCDLAIVASGTAALECAISNTPFIVIYKMSYLSWLITKKIISLEFVSIVNILANKKIVPELLQKDLTIQNIFKKTNSLINKENYAHTKKELDRVVALLGDGGAYKEAASFINNIKQNNEKY